MQNSISPLVLKNRSVLLHLLGGASQKRGRRGQEEGWWWGQEKKSALWYGSKLWRLPGQGHTTICIHSSDYDDEEEIMKQRMTVDCVHALSQAESRKGKRLTGREIKKKTLAERRQQLGIDNLREDALKWVSSIIYQTAT